MACFVVWHVEKDELFEIAVGVEDLNAPVTAVGYVQISLAINSNIVRIADVSGIFVGVRAARAWFAPLLDPVSVFLSNFAIARIEAAITDIDVVLGVPCDIR